MAVKRKILIVGIMLAAFASLLFHETMFHPVWCFKPDGTADLELAFQGFECNCRSHACEAGHTAGTHDTVFSTSACCFDLPAADNRIQRKLPPHCGGVEFTGQLILLNGDSRMTGQFTQKFPAPIPLRKFLKNPAPDPRGTIMRC